MDWIQRFFLPTRSVLIWTPLNCSNIKRKHAFLTLACSQCNWSNNTSIDLSVITSLILFGIFWISFFRNILSFWTCNNVVMCWKKTKGGCSDGLVVVRWNLREWIRSRDECTIASDTSHVNAKFGIMISPRNLSFEHFETAFSCI